MPDKEIINYPQDALYVVNGKWKLPILIAIKRKAATILEKFNAMFQLLQTKYCPLN